MQLPLGVKILERYPMADGIYRILRTGFQLLIWGGEVRGLEKLPEHGPAVLVANHLGALGPIAATASLPRRLYPWIISDMLDSAKAPEYLRVDFIEKELHFRPPLSLWLAKMLCKIAVPLLRSVGCVPVYPDPEGLRGTIEQSLDLLTQEKFLIVFPEDPAQPPDTKLKMSPFKKGFTRLGELFYQRSGKSIWFYPLAIHAGQRLVQVGGPISYNPLTPQVVERLRIRNMLESMIHQMYSAMDSGEILGIPQTQ